MGSNENFRFDPIEQNFASLPRPAAKDLNEAKPACPVLPNGKVTCSHAVPAGTPAVCESVDNRAD